MVIHGVEVNDIRTGGDDGAYFFAQAREIGREDAGGDSLVHRCTCG